MKRRFASTTVLVIIAAVAVVSTSCASSIDVGEPAESGSAVAIDTSTPTPPQTPAPSPTPPPAVADSSAPATRCRDDGSYRARLVETDAATDEVLTEYRYEVADAHLRSEPAGGVSGQVVFGGTDAWTFDSTGWQQLPTVPVRPLRTPWVNNFVTGPAVARVADASGTDANADRLYGLDVKRVVLTYEQFRQAFPDKIGDNDYDPDGTSFTYWLDLCDQIVKAEITTTFGPATAELMGPDFPLTLSYAYESYDLGAEFATITPGEPITPISPPSDS